MHKLAANLILCVLVIPCLSVLAQACTCVSSGSPCGSFKETPVVFVGTVVSIDEENVEIVRFGNKETVRTGLVAHFQVEDALKGIKPGEVDLVTGGGGGDCGYDFEKGEKYLVYAYHSESRALDRSASRTVFAGGSKRQPKPTDLNTTICTRTRPIAYAQDDIALLKALVNGKAEIRLFGFVTQRQQELTPWGFDIKDVGPMPGLKVTAEGPAGKYEGQTDKEGHYQLSGLKPGKYKVTLELPVHYVPLYNFHPNEYDTQVGSDTCGDEHFFDAQIDGRIRGRVYDARGNPVPGQLHVVIATPESATKSMDSVDQRSAYTEDGYFEFDGLAPGKYVLGISIADPPQYNTPYKTVYYRDVDDLAHSQIITLKEGEHLNDYDFHLPEKLELITINGSIFDKNGQPAKGVGVEVYDSAKPDYGLFGINVKTDANGRFSIQLFKGRHYTLWSYVDQNYFAGTGVHASAEVDTSGAVDTVKLVLDQPGIFKAKSKK